MENTKERNFPKNRYCEKHRNGNYFSTGIDKKILGIKVKMIDCYSLSNNVSISMKYLHHNASQNFNFLGIEQ